MHRRTFIRNSSCLVFGVSVFGSISWDTDKYVGDHPTTSDILGPFYRPGAPVRLNINPPDYTGQPFHLSGTIFKQDGKTPFPDCQVEIWQCDENKIYDNTSDDFRCRGRQITKNDGKYHFNAMHPVPYPTQANPNLNRPAHFHMRISGNDHRDLITQVYFKNDPNIQTDHAASAPEAMNRILNMGRNSQNEEEVIFDIIMSKKLVGEKPDYERLTGLYKMNDQSNMEFFRNRETLFWKWNGQILDGLIYKGNYEFRGALDNTIAKFDLSDKDNVSVNFYFRHPITRNIKEFRGKRILKYQVRDEQ